MAPSQRALKKSDPRAPNTNDTKISMALGAMKALGISPEVVKPVLKHLLKLYGGSWELIEEDNYRTLADAIFESIDDKSKQKSKAVRAHDEQEPPLKRLHSGDSEDPASSIRENRSTLGPQMSIEPSMPGQRNNIMESNNQVDDDMEPIVSLIRPVRQLDQSTSRSPPGTNKRLFHKIEDLTKGTEKVKISLIDEIGIGLPNFVYLPKNTSYQEAYVPFSLARIADDGCCLKCSGDCLSSRVPCACSRETGGEFAYTRQGLIKDEFLDACISMNREPQNHHLFYCQECPLERAKNVRKPEPCKGHVLRKFIKECWRKCGCTMECGNRVVQRGTTCKLQVFSTEGKGWALRTLEYLPKGSFICEYIGEILTNMELYERNKQSRKNERHTYPVYLDADWGSEQVLKDEEALCLDATYYGNVARFINHRCYDSNLIEIPVEVETPDHHYYHIAFFTKRNINPNEELTWDYGIDFDDVDHPIKAFQCQCGSSHCRDVRRKGTKDKDLVIKRLASGSSSRGPNHKRVH